MLKKFGIRDLDTLDEGRVAAQVDLALLSAAKDCANRPGLAKERKVTVTFKLTPQTNEDGMCDSINLDVQTKTNVPASNSKLFNMHAHPAQGLAFNDMSPDDAHQRTIDEIPGDNDDDK